MKPETNTDEWRRNEERVAAFLASQKREALFWFCAILCLIVFGLIWNFRGPLAELIKSFAVVTPLGLLAIGGMFAAPSKVMTGEEFQRMADDELPRPKAPLLPVPTIPSRTIELLGLHHATGLFRVRCGDVTCSAESKADALGRMVLILHDTLGPVTITLHRP